MNRQVYYILGATVAGLIILFVGVAAGWSMRPTSASNKTVRESGYQYIRPILLCNLDSSQPANEDKALSAVFANYISTHQDASIGIYYINPTASTWAGANENESFSPASMLKVPMMAAVLRSAEETPELLSKKILYDGSFNENVLQDVTSSKQLVAGKSYTVKELLTYMITYSDNNATRLLHDVLTEEQFEDIYTDLGIEVPSVNGPIDFMSPKTFTLFLRLLFNATYLSHQNSEKALELMSVRDFPAGLAGGIPTSTPIAQKFGERYIDYGPSKPAQTELHNCGIVYPPNGGYLICVMTRGNDFSSLSKIIRDLSEIAYNKATSK